MSVRVAASGMGTQPFEASGASLSISMGWVEQGVFRDSGPEEMVAVMEGAALLVSGDERHELKAGQGVLIPEGMPRRWEVPERALIYRVQAR